MFFPHVAGASQNLPPMRLLHNFARISVYPHDISVVEVATTEGYLNHTFINKSYHSLDKHDSVL
jgi:hypothetical protein